jgi:hypothetical protein
LASNASLWQSPTLERWGYLVQIDHLNSATGFKFTRVMQCGEMPKDKQEEDENCTTLVANVNKLFSFFTNQIKNFIHIFIMLQYRTNLLKDGRDLYTFLTTSSMENGKLVRSFCLTNPLSTMSIEFELKWTDFIEGSIRWEYLKQYSIYKVF